MRGQGVTPPARKAAQQASSSIKILSHSPFNTVVKHAELSDIISTISKHCIVFVCSIHSVLKISESEYTRKYILIADVEHSLIFRPQYHSAVIYIVK